MRTGFRQLLVILLLVAFTSIYLNGTRLFAPDDEDTNYLANVQYNGVDGEWNRSLYGEQSRWASMENYIRLQHAYDEEKNYGLLNSTEAAQFDGEFRQLARSAIHDWESYQVGHARDQFYQKVGTAIPTLNEIRNSKSPVFLVAGVLATAYSGQNLHYRLGTKDSIDSRTILHSSRFEGQYFGWSNSLLGTSIGTSYDNTLPGGPSVSLSKSVMKGVSVTYGWQVGNDTVGMAYTAGF